MATDAFIGDRRKRLPYAIFEFENELGSTHTDKFFQGQGCYAQIIQDTRSHQHRPGCLPCFLLELRGPVMRYVLA